MPSIDDYRSKFPSLRDLPDEALISRVAEVHNVSREDVMAHMGYNPSDGMRGLKESFQQLPQLGWGAVAGVGAAGEAAFGEGGIMSAVKNRGIKGYTEWSDKIESKARESDSFNYSWDQAREGNFGALVDWFQHGLGYVTGQGIQALATAGIGAIGGKMVLSEAAKTVAKGMVQKEAAVIAGTEAGKQLGKDELIKMATSNVASKIGQTVAVGGMAVGQEGGEIFGDLTAQADKDGRQLTGDDLAKAFGATLAAGGLEFVGDKLGLDIVMGKTGLTKMAGGVQGIKGKAARGAIAGAAAIPAEAGTEYFQTGLEEFGKGTEQNMLPFNQSAKAQEGAFDAAMLGGLGGGAIGAAGGLMSKARAKIEQDLATNTLATTTDVGQMIKAAETLAMAPLDEGRALDRLDQLRSEDEKAAKIFGTAPVSAQERAVNSAAMAAAVNNGQASATLTDMPQADRALVLQEQLADPATRQAIREKLGDQALDDALYYAGISDRPDGTLDAPIPEKTRERMLSLAEAIVSRAVLQPINRPGMGGQTAAPGIGMNPAQQRITLDTGSTGNIRVDSAGNAAPETRADAINTAQARQRPDGMTQQVDRRPLPRDAVIEGGAGDLPPGMSPRTAKKADSAPAKAMTDADLIKATVDQFRNTNTPQARAFVGLYDSGKITDDDVLALLGRPPKSPDQRIAEAAAQAPTIQPGDLLTADGFPYGSKSAATVRAKKEGGQVVDVQGGWAVQIQGESNGLPARGTPGPAGLAVGATSGGSDQPAGSIGDLVPDARPAARVDSPAGAPVPGGGTPVAVGDGNAADGALSDIPTLKKQWGEATAAGDTERAKQISDRITALKAGTLKQRVESKKAEKVDTSPAPVQETPKTEQVGPSAQFEAYRNAIEQATVVGGGMVDQIKIDERLADGESERLVALAQPKLRANGAKVSDTKPAAPVTPQAQSKTPAEGAAAPAQPAEKPAKPEAAPKPKRPPKSFRAKQMVTTTVLVEETGKFEKREIDAETAMVALDADINELEAFLKCLKG